MVPKVIVEGAFYSPNASEGRWAWNLCKTLDVMAQHGLIEVDLFIPPHADKQFFFNQTECWNLFPYSKLVRESGKTYDVMFLMQPNPKENGDLDLNDKIKANKRIHGQFELYWYGHQIDQRKNIPDNYEFCYALEPNSSDPSQQKWPRTKHKRYQLPYSPQYEIGSCNFENKGLLLTIKSPIHSDYSEEDIGARIDHFRLALSYARDGLKVTVGYANRLYINPNKIFENEFNEIIRSLESLDNVDFRGNVSPYEMKQLIKNHSILYTGKLGKVILYASFIDALNYGSIPIIHNDWPEQFFKENIFTGYQGIDKLRDETDLLLDSKEYYQSKLSLLRKNIRLHTEEEMIQILKGIINEK